MSITALAYMHVYCPGCGLLMLNTQDKSLPLMKPTDIRMTCQTQGCEHFKIPYRCPSVTLEKAGELNQGLYEMGAAVGRKKEQIVLDAITNG